SKRLLGDKPELAEDNASNEDERLLTTTKARLLNSAHRWLLLIRPVTMCRSWSAVWVPGTGAAIIRTTVCPAGYSSEPSGQESIAPKNVAATVISTSGADTVASWVGYRAATEFIGDLLNFVESPLESRRERPTATGLASWWLQPVGLNY
ncbi:MAG TPA: hypothetical protein VHC22_24045, partial [Pirellulales bacterium]|nr:hypothetical protein [Pirellulales bacterium]